MIEFDEPYTTISGGPEILRLIDGDHPEPRPAGFVRLPTCTNCGRMVPALAIAAAITGADDTRRYCHGCWDPFCDIAANAPGDLRPDNVARDALSGSGAPNRVEVDPWTSDLLKGAQIGSDEVAS